MRKFGKKKNMWLVFLLGIVLVSIMLSLGIISYLYNSVDDYLMSLAYEEARRVVTKIINSSCLEIDNSNLYQIMDNNGIISMIVYNPDTANKILREITLKIQDEIGNSSEFRRDKDNNLIILEVPIGVGFKNMYFANFGPKVGFKIKFLGDVVSNIETEVKPYGVNNAYIEVRVRVVVNAQIIGPDMVQCIEVESIVPIAMSVVNGNIPSSIISSYK